MVNERNALAELADDLRVMSLDVSGDEETIIDKASRIIAELAKCGNYAPPEPWEPEWHLHAEDARRCVENCRAIAEEGAGDATVG